MIEQAGIPDYRPPQAPYAGPDMPPPPAVSAGGHLLRNLLILLGVLALLIAAGVGFAVASGVAATERLNAGAAVRSTVNGHHHDVAAQLNAVFNGLGDVNGTSFDPARGKTALDQASVQLDALRKADEGDITRINAADAKVQDRSLLTAISASVLDREHRRLGAYHDGLRAEIAEVATITQQLGLVGELVTTLAGLQTLNTDLTAHKISAAESDYAAPSATLDKLIADAASAPDTPSTLNEFLTIFRSEVTHIKGVVDGIQNHSVSQIQSNQAELHKDIDALEKFDSAAMKKQYEDLGAKLDAKVNAELNRAK
jgi:hypothetical protein